MMGPAKLSEIRAAVRQAFKASDAELLAWFDHQLEEQAQKPNGNTAALDALRLLRDALLNETQRATPRRAAGGSRTGGR